MNLFKHLLPRALAWSLTINKQLRQFFAGLVAPLVTDVRLYFECIILDLFPQDTRELDKWENQFGIIDPAPTEQERRDRLAGAWKATGGQSPRYIQDTLQSLGFDVYVHEWWVPASGSPPTVRNPFDYLSPNSNDPIVPPKGYPLVNIISTTQKEFEFVCGETFAECGEDKAEAGEFAFFSLIRVNYTIPADSTKYPYFLYIGGQTFPNMVQIPAARRLEFERACLKICPAQQWLGILVEYV